MIDWQYKLIQNWIKQGEGPTLDFKKVIKSPVKIAKTMVAYANSRGGRIVVGITDEGRVKGVKPEGEKHHLFQAAKDYCRPLISLSFEELNFNGATVLVVHIQESNEKPHYAVEENGQLSLYVRVQDESIVAPDFIATVLKSGDLNHIYRTPKLVKAKEELITYLKEVKMITMADYMTWRNTSERSANRFLVDMLLEGVIFFKLENNEIKFFL